MTKNNFMTGSGENHNSKNNIVPLSLETNHDNSFSIESNSSQIDSDLSQIYSNLSQVERGLSRIDGSLSDIDTNLIENRKRLSNIETRLSQIEERLKVLKWMGIGTIIVGISCLVTLLVSLLVSF